MSAIVRQLSPHELRVLCFHLCVMKTRTYKQVEAAKRRAELAAANLQNDESRADDYADMSVEEYAALRGITVQNPNLGDKKMAKSLKQQLDEANARVEELESEREDILDALGIEIVDEESDDEDE